MVKTLRTYFVYSVLATIIVLFIVGLFMPIVSAVIIDTTDHRKPEDNLARIPAPLHSFMQFMSPETYVAPKREAVGKLLSVQISPGGIANVSSIETTVGYYVVAGIVSANKNSSVSLNSIEAKSKTKVRLCIDPDAISCYSLIDSRSL